MGQSLKRPLTERSVHLCIDMQRIFSEEGPWPTPWMKRVLPVVISIVERHPERTIFTRFITPQRAEQMPGMWRQYYEAWPETTQENLEPHMLDLVSPLDQFTPPAAVVNKPVYSAFARPELPALLAERKADALVVTGSETDVCVLATVLGAVDFGYRVIVVRDAICSSSDEGHDALLKVYGRRYGQQIELADAEDILSAWN
jgi:nicotinamidase-related amidase